jgi:prepilin-type processing-associated H-X9-DG protein
MIGPATEAVMRKGSRRGVTLSDVVILIAAAALLAPPLAIGIFHVREKSYKVACAANLRNIGQGMLRYANNNKGQYPVARYTRGAPLTSGTGAAAPDPFNSPNRPADNDVTAAIFLLLRAPETDLTAQVFLCTSPDIDVTVDRAASNSEQRSNFSDVAANLSYSMANMYPDARAVASGYMWNTHLNADFAIAGDMNPGVGNGYDVTLPSDYTSTAEQMKRANSRNHAAAGQNVLYGDGHVNFETNPFCGTKRDNVYTNASNDTVTTSKLPPTGAGAMPGWPGDSVLLPVATRGAFPGTETRTGWIIAASGAAILLIVGGIIAARAAKARRRRAIMD